MAAKISAETPISDFTPGSVILTLLEAAASEDFQQYVQMLNIIRNYNLDTTEGTDLDARASEYGLTRLSAASFSGYVSIKDSSFTKISTKVYAGLSGPTAGSLIVNVDDASSLPASGAIYIGRGTTASEGPLSYSTAPVDNGSYWTITLDSVLANDHGTDETIVLSQGGTRVISAGTEVAIPESDVSAAVLFELNQQAELLDGEDTLENVFVTALEAGGTKVPANSIVNFPNPPFTGATVTNPLPFVNGREQETDQELRDRIRDTTQALSRGTPAAIKTAITGLLDANSNTSVVSANIVPPVILADGPTKIYIDNGSGLEPSLAAVGLESLKDQASGGEKFFQVLNFPVTKASLVTQNSEPYALSGAETLIIRVGTNEEAFTFVSADFDTAGKALATEIAEAINNRAQLIEARTITISNVKKVIISPIARANEEIQVDPSSTSQSALNFSELEVSTMKLYKNDKLLTKDGVTASVLSLAQPYNLQASVVTLVDGDITVTPNSRIVTKSVAGTQPFKQFVHEGSYVKFSSDTDTFYRKVRSIPSDTKLILDEAYPNSGGGLGNITIWNSQQLEVAANGDDFETEVISFGPNDFTNPIQALASEVEARLTSDLNLSKSELAVNNTKVKIISELTNTSASKMQILGGGAALALGFCTTSSLSGTISTTGGGLTLTGSGTSFTTELVEGQWIKADLDDSSAWTKVETIESDTIAYLASGYRGRNRSSVAASKVNLGELSVGKDKDFTLNRSNGQIELSTSLAANDNLTVGSINTRAFQDSLAQTYNFSALGSTSTLTLTVDGGLQGTVSTADVSAPYSSVIDAALKDYEAGSFVGFYLEFLTGANTGQNSLISAYNPATGEVTLASPLTNATTIGDKFVIAQVVTFIHASDFVDPINATAAEVVTALNSRLLGAIASVKLNTKVRIQTANFGAEGKLQIKGGTANQILGFSTVEETNQLTNLAYLQSTNTDRKGNIDALGFTLGPDQNLVAIFDGDSLNKTFSVSPQVKGTVTTGGTGAFSDTSVGADYTSNSYFSDFWIYWTSGLNTGSLQTVLAYTGVTGAFVTQDIFPAVMANPIAIGDTYTLVPRTAENVAKILNNYKVTTMSIVSDASVVGVTGDSLQISSKLPGSAGKVFITGGSANGIGIQITGVPAGSPVNDLETSSKAGLAKGLLVALTADATVTTGDGAAPYNSLTATSLITATVDYFTGMTLEFLTGNNAGKEFVIDTYDNTTGQITLLTAAANAINIGDTFRVKTTGYIVDLQGTTAPYTVKLNDAANAALDVTYFTPQRLSAIRDVNALGFSTVQTEGVDGYKYFTNLIQKTQWTIDGLDTDPVNYPGYGASGTQYEVLPPVLVRVKLILNVTPNQGVSLSAISESVRTAVLEYVNSRKVSDDVILSEIVAAAQSVSGVADITISNHAANIVIADNELARLATADLIIG